VRHQDTAVGCATGPGAGARGRVIRDSRAAPGSAGIYKSDAELTAALKKAIAAANGNQSTSPIANTDQYRINIVHREKAAGALAHEGNTELHYIIEGTGVVVTGGTIDRGTAASTAPRFRVAKRTLSRRATSSSSRPDRHIGTKK
jgi:hypothetical protein